MLLLLKLESLKKRLKDISKQSTKLKEENDGLSAKWYAEKITFENLHNLRKKIDDLRRQAEVAEDPGRTFAVSAGLGHLPGDGGGGGGARGRAGELHGESAFGLEV